ncbi:hypothetical protein Ahy_B08g090946 [Arachis hypogaea]|uniref:RNase H type-1 domain-containing protein n=1 Tax=Arachis hypogaea TaxID=3818 RepID=A0A444Y106_ARAHY|nr:hypothetical protein Ahy_B08g090946 [Arachis hypogaea]
MADRIGESRRITWRPPPRNKVKVNIDAAFQRETGIAASAAVIRDWQGKIITGTSSKFKSTSALAAEAQAYREALILTKNLQIRNCIIESDCLPLVQAIKARTPLAEADAIIRDILQLLEEAPDVGATWTPREGNSLAHQLAAMAAVNQLQRQWTVTPSVQVRNIIITEAGFVILQNNLRNRTQENQGQNSSQQRGSSGHIAVVSFAISGRCQGHQGELQRGRQVAPVEYSTLKSNGRRTEAGDIALEDTQQLPDLRSQNQVLNLSEGMVESLHPVDNTLRKWVDKEERISKLE